VQASHLEDHALEPDTSSVRTARRLVADVAGDDVPAGEMAGLLLATSEVVTNAVEHGAAPIHIRVTREDDSVRVEVHDGSPLPPRVRQEEPGPWEVRGRGMMIVERCTSRWGIDDEVDGKSVWFEVSVPAGDAGQRRPNDSTPPR
jgi:anti-sigma regulatory factor (Ser/Thr protein kinase)